MRDENEPNQATDNKYQRSGNENLLQYFHIFLLIRIMYTGMKMYRLQIL
jgi:hypothetical protein